MRTEPQDELYQVVQENLEISKKTLRAAEKTQKALFWMSVSTWVRTLLWIIPLVLALIYIPRLIATFENQVRSFTGGGDGGLFQNSIKLFQNSPELQRAVDQFRQIPPPK